MIIKGKVYKFGDDINTDEIIPARYLNTSDPVILAQHCMEDARPGFADQIEANSKANGGKLTPLLTRAKMWSNRYNAIVTIAQQVSCADKKFKWHLGPTEEHCGDCLTYAGRVHRGSVWASVGAAPQSRSLACGGWNCLCALSPTTDRASGGRPPRPSGG